MFLKTRYIFKRKCRGLEDVYIHVFSDLKMSTYIYFRSCHTNNMYLLFICRMKMKKMKKERRRKVMGGWYLMVICLMMKVLTMMKR